MKKFIALIMVLVMSLSVTTSALAGDYAPGDGGIVWIGLAGMENRFHEKYGTIPIITYSVVSTPEGDVLYAELSVPHRQNAGTPPAIRLDIVSNRLMVNEEKFMGFLEQHSNYFECMPWEPSGTEILLLYPLKEAGDFLREVVPGLVDLELVVTESGDYRVDLMVDSERYSVVLDDVPESGLIKAQTITDLFREWQER